MRFIAVYLPRTDFDDFEFGNSSWNSENNGTEFFENKKAPTFDGAFL